MFRRLADFGGYASVTPTARPTRPCGPPRGRHRRRARRADPFDTLVDIVLADELRTVLWPRAPDDDDAHWALRHTLWDDDDVSSAAATPVPTSTACAAARTRPSSSPTCLRGRGLVPLERAVHALTDKPARLFGLRDRGRVAVGAIADLVVFDPETVGAEPATLVRDLPGGASAWSAASTGVRRVYVNGVETVVDGESTGRLAGHRAAVRAATPTPSPFTDDARSPRRAFSRRTACPVGRRQRGREGAQIPPRQHLGVMGDHVLGNC